MGGVASWFASGGGEGSGCAVLSQLRRLHRAHAFGLVGEYQTCPQWSHFQPVRVTVLMLPMVAGSLLICYRW